MEAFRYFPVSGWDYLTFLVIFMIGVAFLAFVIFILGLPGRIAIARNHPEATQSMPWDGSLFGRVRWILGIYLGFQTNNSHRHPLFAGEGTARNRGDDQTPQGEAPAPDAEPRLQEPAAVVTAAILCILLACIFWLVFFRLKLLRLTPGWGFAFVFFVRTFLCS